MSEIRKQKRERSTEQKTSQKQKRRYALSDVYETPDEYLEIEPEDTTWDDERETSVYRDLEYNIETLGYEKPLQCAAFILKTKKGYRCFFTKPYEKVPYREIVEEITEKLNEGKEIEEIKGNITSGGKSRTNLKKYGVVIKTKENLYSLNYFTAKGRPKKESAESLAEHFLEKRLEDIKIVQSLSPSKLEEKLEKMLDEEYPTMGERKKKEVKKHVLKKLQS
ncbi:hypothetical protein [Thermotoga sp. SG1]|uniref:hypothetical protein n=1 Tax=Thermotoga sp. SG1 TaxID=126739 RepID=UPI000C759C2A|nr:hypothetical protein [Thermotoga sp. SG1]PLV57141.1 hypothetical protein AS006_02265 [Thermotoga sp. SG1]